MLKAKLIKALTSTVLPVVLLGVSSIAFAQNTLPRPITSDQTLGTFMCNIVWWFFWMILAISLIMLLYAAFQYVTARDDVEKTSRARKTITYAAIGIAVAFIAAGFPNIIATVLPGTVTLPAVGTCIAP